MRGTRNPWPSLPTFRPTLNRKQVFRVAGWPDNHHWCENQIHGSRNLFQVKFVSIVLRWWAPRAKVYSKWFLMLCKVVMMSCRMSVPMLLFFREEIHWLKVKYKSLNTILLNFKLLNYQIIKFEIYNLNLLGYTDRVKYEFENMMP